MMIVRWIIRTRRVSRVQYLFLYVVACECDSTCLKSASDGSLRAVGRKIAESSVQNGSTALHFASYYGSDAVVRLLLERGASVEARDNVRWWRRGNPNRRTRRRFTSRAATAARTNRGSTQSSASVRRGRGRGHRGAAAAHSAAQTLGGGRVNGFESSRMDFVPVLLCDQRRSDSEARFDS